MCRAQLSCLGQGTMSEIPLEVYVKIAGLILETCFSEFPSLSLFSFLDDFIPPIELEKSHILCVLNKLQVFHGLFLLWIKPASALSWVTLASLESSLGFFIISVSS